ncbi:MAG: hypothetical protein L0387_00350 [Acidobacteria bacterium]|nr:hypothetical protein [Acidobacteriota bacterium]MCI0718695.1 hypothetical protein [Acidobacteriota bacterium]
MSYQEFLTPEKEHWQFRPSRHQLRRILGHLFATGWLRPESECDPDSLIYLHPSKIPDQMKTTPDQCLSLYLEGGPGGSAYPDEWPEDQLEFTANLCEDIFIIDSPEALILPAGEMDFNLPCPACGDNVLLQLSPWDQGVELKEDVEWPPYTRLAANGYHRAPKRCMACSQELKLREMAIRSNGEQIENVPFFHFCIAILAARSPASQFTSADPELLDALQGICGVRFRAAAREV